MKAPIFAWLTRKVPCGSLVDFLIAAGQRNCPIFYADWTEHFSSSPTSSTMIVIFRRTREDYRVFSHHAGLNVHSTSVRGTAALGGVVASLGSLFMMLCFRAGVSDLSLYDQRSHKRVQQPGFKIRNVPSTGTYSYGTVENLLKLHYLHLV